SDPARQGEEHVGHAWEVLTPPPRQLPRADPPAQPALPPRMGTGRAPRSGTGPRPALGTLAGVRAAAPPQALAPSADDRPDGRGPALALSAAGRGRRPAVRPRQHRHSVQGPP